MVLLYTSLAALSLSALSSAQSNPPAGATWPTDLVGTWSTKSNQTLTGPGFYDPLNEELIEPSLTGISYSFTSDGYYEEAYYRAISNPTDPSCPGGIMQWQHGSWFMNSTGSLQLHPIKVDGRQLLSSPCDYSNSIYTRYNQSETFQRYSVYTDPYHGILRLDLFQFNGAPLQPMYIAYQPPQMLPTTTLHPLTTASATGKSKRGLELNNEVPLNWKLKMQQDGSEVVTHINVDRLWWIGLSMTGLGGLLYLGPRRMGIHL